MTFRGGGDFLWIFLRGLLLILTIFMDNVSQNNHCNLCSLVNFTLAHTGTVIKHNR